MLSPFAHHRKQAIVTLDFAEELMRTPSIRHQRFGFKPQTSPISGTVLESGSLSRAKASDHTFNDAARHLAEQTIRNDAEIPSRAGDVEQVFNATSIAELPSAHPPIAQSKRYTSLADEQKGRHPVEKLVHASAPARVTVGRSSEGQTRRAGRAQDMEQAGKYAEKTVLWQNNYVRVSAIREKRFAER